MIPVVSLKNLTKRYGNNLVLDKFCLDVFEGEFVTLLGPSGCGKTTILRLIAGFEPPTDGTILLNGKDVTNVPPYDRNVNTVFQSYALFPHLTVYDNVAFGLKIKKFPKNEIKKRVSEALNMVQLHNMEKRSVLQLSGGQQQRVAIARAIVNKPKVLLFDEPLSALDYKLRKDMQIEFKHIHKQLGITFIFVTHDQEEAIAMSDRIIVMNEGKIEQDGTPKEVYEKPANLYVAKFVGEINIFDGIVEGHEDNKFIINISGETFRLESDKKFEKGDRVKILLRPEDLVIYYSYEECDRKFLWGEVEEYVYKGATVDVTVSLDNGQTILITEFFNDDEENIEYSQKQRIKVTWREGWEVILPDE